jgi:hypothetical protein
MVFVETPVFTRLITAALSDREYAALQQELADHPDSGRLIEGGAGIRKVRWAQSGIGKRGGFRIIYYWRMAEDQIYLLYVFGKNAKADLNRTQLKQLAQAARALK